MQYINYGVHTCLMVKLSIYERYWRLKDGKCLFESGTISWLTTIMDIWLGTVIMDKNMHMKTGTTITIRNSKLQ